MNIQAERERHRNAGGISETSDSEPGKYFTATAAAYDSAEPERSAGLDACGEIDDDANEEESSNFACRIARNL